MDLHHTKFYILHAGSSNQFFHTTSTVTISTYPDSGVSIKFVFKCINMPSIHKHITSFHTLFTQKVHTPPSSISQQDADLQQTNIMWTIIAIAFIAVALLLAITSIVLGTALYFTKIRVKSESPTELTLHQGRKGCFYNNVLL